MIDLSTLCGQSQYKTAAVFGLGVSGMASVVALVKGGFNVLVWDDNEAQRIKAQEYGAEICDMVNNFPVNTDFLVLSPGVPLTHPEPHAVVKAAQVAGVEILCDIELLHRAMPHIKKIGITGTNGKSTTTALIGHILKEAGSDVDVGGNLGIPALAFNMLGDDGIYVIEMSSYQLDLCPTFTPDISILLNITPDHLDRHGGIDGYATAKARIFGDNSVMICSTDDTYSRHIFENTSAAEKIALSIKEDDTPIDLSNAPALRGEHNKQNALAAYYACRAAGLSDQDIQKGINSFPGLDHRQKLVRQLKGIDFVNDSKATNDEAAAKALSSFNNIYWIAGGRAKGKDYPECAQYFDRIQKAYLIGEGAADLDTTLSEHDVPTSVCKILHAAVFHAYEDARADIDSGKVDHAVILLSPACASWDQFNNFEQRGLVFVECVNYLPQRLPEKFCEDA